MWPDAARGKWDAFIRPNLYVSLLPENCGAYTFGAWGGLYTLRGDASDARRIDMGEQRPDLGGYYLGQLVAKHTGWLPQNVVPNLLQRMGKRLSVSDRFRFSVKANYRHVLMEKKFTAGDAVSILTRLCPAPKGIASWKLHPYTTEDGKISYYVLYFTDGSGYICKLTISAWEPEVPTETEIVYDILNIPTPYPLYRLHSLVQHSEAPFALVCDSEDAVEYIEKNHAWLSTCMPVTTYCALDGADWSKLKGKTPIIFPDASKRGCHEAFQTHATLVKQGLEPLFMPRQKGGKLGSKEAIQDLLRLASDGGRPFPEFAAHSQREFGVQPPAGILPKAIPLSALPEPAGAPEPLMDGLLDAGELMMVYAWRGLGKSLFAMLLALCFVSGKSALNGRICPSRKYRVLVLDGEMSSHSLKKRGRRLCLGHELPEDANDEVMVRSKILENNKLTLETEEGRKEYNPDLELADIIIVDPMYKFFPEAMESEFSAVDELLDFLEWCRLNRKTLILIDHEGKGRGTSFGTMGKEIALDVVLRLCHAKSPHAIEAHVQKVRDHAEPSGAYLRMRIEADNERIAYQVSDDRKGAAALEGESLGTPGEAKSTESLTGTAMSPVEAIKQLVRENPDKTQAEIVRALQAMGYTQARSTLNGYIKKLADAGELPVWLNGPGAHNAAGQPASEDDED